MKEVVVTEKLRINLSLEIAEELVSAFTNACNFVAQSSHEMKRRRNAVALHGEFYHKVRETFGLGAQYTCSVMRVVSSKWKVSKTTTPVFRREFPQLQSGKDFSFTRKGLSVSTMTGRKVVDYFDNNGRVTWLLENAKVGGAKLLISRGKVYLAITFSYEVETVAKPLVIGVDTGITHAAVTSTRKFIDVSPKYLEKRTKIRNKRAELQSLKGTGKNTRGVRKLLKRLSGREARLTRNEMHVVSKNIVKHAISSGAGRVVFEDLKGVQSGRWNHGWSHYMLRSYAEYKLHREGIDVEYVDPRYTSQACSQCGHTEKKNRKGSLFCCVGCGYKLNSDLNAAYNIRMRSIVLRQVPEEPGESQHAPDVREDSSESQSPVDKPVTLVTGS